MTLSKNLMTGIAVVALGMGGTVALGYSAASAEGNAPKTESMEQNYEQSMDPGPDTNVRGTESESAMVQDPVEATPETIKTVQSSLEDKGFSVTADGKWGPQTAAAIQNFQKANNLPVTGNLNTETLAALDIDKM